MKTIYLITVLLIYILSSIIPTNTNVNETDEFNVGEFKRYFFRSCIEYGFTGDPCIGPLLSKDSSPLNDFPLGMVGYGVADSIAHEVRKEIMEDSISLFDKVGYEVGQKRVFLICLEHFGSTELDSIAKSLFSNDD